MKTFFLCLLALTMTLLAGCSKGSDPEKEEAEMIARISADQGQVLYYDRNGDGKVDLETHHYPGSFDRDWELRDDDFNGRYEKKVVFGMGIIKSDVDIPVPTGVKIETERKAPGMH